MDPRGVTDQDRYQQDFGALFRATYGELCNYTHGYVASRAVAEELVQDVFMRAWERRATSHWQMPSRTYLFHAARNRAIDHLRHERVISRTSPEVILELDRSTLQADSDLNANDFREALQLAIEQLPPGTRQVFVMCKTHGMKYAEIAETLGISPKTVEGQMSRAFRILRTRLEDFLPMLVAAVSSRLAG